ncbi:MAG TPA: LemA family protein [Gemmatimonadales bacterium]|nr:LemA family protein [Gemmatimonadales bacterium]
MTIALIGGSVVLAWAVFTFNRLIRLRQLGDNAWADIDVQLKRRHDLIPSVVAVVQGHAGYERSTLEALTQARSRAIQAATAGGPATRARQEDPLGNALGRVFAVAEAYPELRAVASFAGLQTTLTDVEDHLQNARRYYNAVVRDFNTAIAQFPASLIAGVMRLHPREFFGLDDPTERAVPRVPLALVLLLLCPTALAAQRSLSIERFDARIVVNRNSGLDVTETITARFVGSWNGLYRTIPVDYHTPQGFNWTLGLSLESARDEVGHNLRTATSREGAYVKYKIWIPGAQDAERTVVLHYHATNGLRFFDEHDELYWNVTGDQWDVPLNAATAVIELPPGTPGVRAIAFNGAYGSTARESRVTIDGSTVRITMPPPHALGYHEGLTAVVGWDKGVVTAPTTAERALATLRSNWPLLIPVGVLLFGFLAWRRWGADPHRRPIAVQYSPPERMSPAEAGTLLDNSADMRDITATMVDLAVRGFLRIEEREQPALFGLFGGGREYSFRRLKPVGDTNANELKPHENRVFHGIFSGRGDSVDLSDLKDEFYTQLKPIRDHLYDGLVEQGFYRWRPDNVRNVWIGIGIFFGIAVGVLGWLVAARFQLTPIPFIIAGVVSGLILLAFSTIMPARTDSGTRALEQVLGFDEFLRRVESEHLKRIIVGHPELFDKYLPFAMAFGVEKQFARAFEGIYTQPPQWYVGPSVVNFNVSNFSSSLSQLGTVAGTTLSSSPRSSGGSGFGGGGGSGGGGGGGGGGGF